MLAWDKGNNREIVEDMRKDACGEFSPTRDKPLYWASFLDGMQRVLLFTEIKEIAESSEASNLLEVIQREVNVSVHGIGLSLVNNHSRQEIMYLAVASSGIIWESCRVDGRRYKPLGHKLSANLEAAYQHFLLRQGESDEEGIVTIDGKTTVDFKSSLILKPNKKKIRRTFETGMWLQMKSSPSQMQLHAKINRLQIDNQMFDCIFPVVLAPVPPPKSVAVDSGEFGFFWFVENRGKISHSYTISNKFRYVSFVKKDPVSRYQTVCGSQYSPTTNQKQSDKTI